MADIGGRVTNREWRELLEVASGGMATGLGEAIATVAKSGAGGEAGDIAVGDSELFVPGTEDGDVAIIIGAETGIENFFAGGGGDIAWSIDAAIPDLEVGFFGDGVTVCASDIPDTGHGVAVARIDVVDAEGGTIFSADGGVGNGGIISKDLASASID